jgi:dodecin
MGARVSQPSVPAGLTACGCDVFITGYRPRAKVGPMEVPHMSVARITEISSTSPQSFEDAIKQGLGRAAETLRGIRGAWIKEMTVDVRDGNISDYRVNMLVTFVLEE